MTHGFREIWTSGRHSATRWAVLATAAASLGGCDRTPPAAPAPAPLEVHVVTVEPVSAPVKLDFVAQTEASRTVEIRARVPGFLLRRPFEEGGIVQKGDLLFQIDQRNYKADLDIARARQAQAEAIAALAEVTLSRTKEAAALGGSNQQEVDEARAELEEAQAGVSLAKGNVANAELNLEYTTMLSPLQGRIGKSPVYEGAYVEAGTNGLLATVQQSDPIYVDFSISERDVLQWQSDVMSGSILLDGVEPISSPAPGMTEAEARIERLKRTQKSAIKVAITLSDGSSYPSVGTLNFVDVSLDPTTGTAQVRAQLPNPEGLIKPGQFVTARILGFKQLNVLVVPKKALMQQPTGQFLYVVGADNKAELRPVEAGQWFEESWIIRKGLNPGDKVIVDQLLTLRPSAPVSAVAASAESTSQESGQPSTQEPAQKSPKAPAQEPARESPTEAIDSKAPSKDR